MAGLALIIRSPTCNFVIRDCQIPPVSWAQSPAPRSSSHCCWRREACLLKIFWNLHYTILSRLWTKGMNIFSTQTSELFSLNLNIYPAAEKNCNRAGPGLPSCILCGGQETTKGWQRSERMPHAGPPGQKEWLFRASNYPARRLVLVGEGGQIWKYTN